MVDAMRLESVALEHSRIGAAETFFSPPTARFENGWRTPGSEVRARAALFPIPPFLFARLPVPLAPVFFLEQMPGLPSVPWRCGMPRSADFFRSWGPVYWSPWLYNATMAFLRPFSATNRSKPRRKKSADDRPSSFAAGAVRCVRF